MRRAVWAVLSTSLLVVSLTSASPVAAGSQGDQGTSDYIVVLQPGTDGDRVAQEHSRREDAKVHHVLRHALDGYVARMSPASAARVERDPRVAWVEADQEVRIANQTVPTGVQRVFADENANLDIDSTDDLRVDVDIAVIDTGIDLDHPDLNVVASTDCRYSDGGPPWTRTYSCGDGGDDGNGHGTHVAGSAAAIDDVAGVVGVAPGARLWAVKVLDDNGSGSMGAVVAGVDYVTGKADQVEVANMSLGCSCSSDSLDTAIANSVAAGVVYAVAAGNDDADAKDFSPANHPDVITVSALADFDGEPGALADPTCRTDEDDTLANFSNWGSLVELAAPGVCILSTWKGGGYHTISGTSMASPHVAGAAGLLASGSNDPQDKADVDAIIGTLETTGNLDWTDDSGDGVQEPLLDVGDETVFAPATVPGGGGGTTNSSPTASFTFSCADLACDFDGSGSSDSDGTISSYDWDFGDGAIASGVTVSHTYGSAGDYTVVLTVTDDGGATDSDSQVVSVTDGSGDFTLDATGYKVKGRHHVDLVWSGNDQTSGTIDVYEGGVVVIDETADDGSETYATNRVGGGSFTYKVCEPDTAACSNEVTVTF